MGVFGKIESKCGKFSTYGILYFELLLNKCKNFTKLHDYRYIINLFNGFCSSEYLSETIETKKIILNFVYC